MSIHDPNSKLEEIWWGLFPFVLVYGTLGLILLYFWLKGEL